jgi:hypothetical protein
MYIYIQAQIQLLNVFRNLISKSAIYLIKIFLWLWNSRIPSGNVATIYAPSFYPYHDKKQYNCTITCKIIIPQSKMLVTSVENLVRFIFLLNLILRSSTFFIYSSYTVFLRCRGFSFFFGPYTIGRTPWTSDRPVARPLHKYKTI